MNYPSVSIRAAQSGLQSAPACRMQWVCHHLFRSYDRNPSNIANIRLYSVSGHTICCKDKLLFWNLQEKGRKFPIKNIMSQSILSKRVLQSYFSFVFWKHQMQAKTGYHKAITITVITVFQRTFYTESRIVNSFNYRYNIIIYIIILYL